MSLCPTSQCRSAGGHSNPARRQSLRRERWMSPWQTAADGGVAHCWSAPLQPKTSASLCGRHGNLACVTSHLTKVTHIDQHKTSNAFYCAIFCYSFAVKIVATHIWLSPNCSKTWFHTGFSTVVQLIYSFLCSLCKHRNPTHLLYFVYEGQPFCRKLA